MNIKYIAMAMFMGLISPVFSQENKPQEVIVRVEQTQAPRQSSNIEKANEYVEFGKNVGDAMREGLSALTDEANKFAQTDAGRFTMLVIAYKVAGQDAIKLVDRFVGIIVGILVIISLTIIYVWVIRKSFICHKVCIEKSGFFWNKQKKYKVVNEEISGDKTGIGILITVVYLIIVNTILWNAIF